MAQFPLGNVADVPIVFPYTAIDLTSAIDVIGNQWGLLGDMGMFREDGVDTTVVEIRYRDGFITVLSSAERGTIPQVAPGDDQAAVFVPIPHFPELDSITPHDLQDRWAFPEGGGDSQVLRRNTLEEELAHRMQRIALKHDITLEYLRMGAIKGQLYDGKGKLLVDLFAAFHVTQQVFSFAFSDPNFEVQQFTYQVARYIELNLHGDISTGVVALCSPEFFDAFTSHPKVQIFFLNWRSEIAGDTRKGFKFGAITFIEYNAQVPTTPLAGLLQQQTQGMAGMTRFIEPSTAYSFPEGTRDSFHTYFGPPYAAPFIASRGVKRFVSPKILDHLRGVELLSESNPLPICRRPNVLVKFTMS
jgi:hypothetical protein